MFSPEEGRRRAVESVTLNESFYQIGLLNKETGARQVFALGRDGACWELRRGAWHPSPPDHPLVNLGKILEAQRPVLDG